ncbi:MAG TPA: GSU2403 family nucleotidyltransferase fold protein [Xanthobacteraceae bacterium]|jgi:hypothetical protein
MAAPLVAQTTYAELLERCEASYFSEDFAENGTFSSKTIKDRRYWYFQNSTAQGRAQRYVGPETPELLERIKHHREKRDDEKERRALVSALTRAFGLPAPIAPIGDVVAALARAGVFRLRSVLVGTVAYQSYPAILGAKLPNALLQTSDVDIAQFTSISVAIGDQTAPILDILRDVDKTFREIPGIARRAHTTSYIGKSGLRVDFVTPNEGKNTDFPQNLPALQTDAQPLRYLDFLIHDPISAVMLHKSGILVLVPAPERFAVHKLMLALERPAAVTKRDKDLSQAEALILMLLERRSDDLRLAWEEAYGRGPKWRKLILGGMTLMSSEARDSLLQVLQKPREILPGIKLTFAGTPPQYDPSREVISFLGEALGHPVMCAVSREALDDHFGSDEHGKEGALAAFHRNRSKIERMVKAKYLSWPVEGRDSVLLSSSDVDKLSR